MGFTDKVKQHAALAKAKAQKSAEQHEAEVEEVEAALAADEVLRELGIQILLERTGRGSATTEATIGDYLELLKEYEAEFGALNIPVAEGEATS